MGSCGYQDRIFESEAAESEITAVEQALAKRLRKTVPSSFPGIAARLHAVLEMEDPGSALSEAPWPELRKILLDLIRLCEGSPGAKET